MNKRIILVGASASGKDYFRDWISNIETIDTSFTTRPKRTGEKEGYTYNYISKTDFLTLKDNDFFLESVVFNDWNYGTSKDNWREKTVFIMTPSGAKHIPKEDRDDCILVYFDISVDIRRERLGKRSDSDTIDRRIAADEEDFKTFEDFNIRITNPSFDAKELYKTILNYKKI